MNISILILTCNNLNKTKACLTSLEYTLELDNIYEWVIIDNASTDGTKEYLRDKYFTHPKIHLDFSDVNLGVAAGRNKLMEKAKGDHFLILDSDVLVLDQLFLDQLIPHINNEHIGIVGAHGTNFDKNLNPILSNIEGFIDVVFGFCQLFKRDVVDQGCKLDLYYNPFWHEDCDFCLQINTKLNKQAYVVDINHKFIEHTSSRTNANHKDNIRKWQYFQRKWKNKYIPLTYR